MRYLGTAGTAAAAAAAMLIFAPPGWAEPTSSTEAPAPDVTGTYQDTGTGETWTVTRCGADCLTVSAGSGEPRHLHLDNGRWVSAPFVGTVPCPIDGSEADAKLVTTVDPGFTGYTDRMLAPVGTCENGYPAIGERKNIGGSLVKTG